MVYLKVDETDRPLRGRLGVAVNFGEHLNNELYKKMEKSGHYITVMDIGSGERALALRDIMKENPSIKGIALNYRFDRTMKNPENLLLADGDVFFMHNLKESADFSYSAFLLHGIKDTFPLDHVSKNAEAMVEIAKSLKHGGVSLLHNPEYADDSFCFDGMVKSINEMYPDFSGGYKIEPVGMHMRLERLR